MKVLNLELFIARKIHFKGNDKEKISSPAIKIATIGIALGLATMILAISIVIGFKHEIRDKVVGFGSHIQVLNFNDFGSTSSLENQPICINDTLIDNIKKIDGVKHLEAFANRAGIIKTDKDFQGVVLKGIDDNYDWTFFNQNMVEGEVLQHSDSIDENQTLISEYIANKLNLKVGDSFICYFIQEPVKARKFTIRGIYNTNFEDYDKIFIVTNINLVKRLNAWEDDQVSGLEIFVNDFDQLETVRDEVFFTSISHRDRLGNTLIAKSIEEINPMIFHWLGLLDMNVWVIIILMMCVSGFTMISGLLILILERTNMIGILKALGAPNKMIRKTFLHVASFIILKGMLWGNIIALVICFVQKWFGIITLDPSTYYVSEMPIEINWIYILLVNIGAFIVSLAMMLGPSYLIAKISPAKSIKFE